MWFSSYSYGALLDGPECSAIISCLRIKAMERSYATELEQVTKYPELSFDAVFLPFHWPRVHRVSCK